MVVLVNLHYLSKYCGGRKETGVELPAGADVRLLIKTLGIPAGETGVILMNRDHVLPDDKLADGAVLDIYPTVIGG
jgi:sulfur carrier protein ThiS